jgi:hypothetical protein
LRTSWPPQERISTACGSSGRSPRIVEIEFAPTVEATSTRRDAYDATASVRAWQSDDGGRYLSVTVRPLVPDEEPALGGRELVLGVLNHRPESSPIAAENGRDEQEAFSPQCCSSTWLSGKPLASPLDRL